LFTLISPTVRAHLHLLSRLGFVLQNRDFKAALQRQASRDELAEAMTRAEAALPAANGADGKG
jgi:PTS system nitrogen regulatory IIA component